MKYTIYVSKFIVLFLILCFVGGIFTVKGLFDLHYRNNAKSVYALSQVQTGRYIECDITFEQMIGQYYTDINGNVRFGPVWTVGAVTMENQYIIRLNEDAPYYMALVVPEAMRPQIQRLIDGETQTYHIYGRFKKLKYDNSDRSGEWVDLGAPATPRPKFSKNYEIKILDPDETDGMWYKGLIFFLIGLFGARQCVEK